MNYYVEIVKNTQTTNCVKQIKQFTDLDKANDYFKNALLELKSEDKGFIELGEYKIIYRFTYHNRPNYVQIEKDDLKKSHSFIKDYLMLNSKSNYFNLKIYKIKNVVTTIEF